MWTATDYAVVFALPVLLLVVLIATWWLSPLPTKAGGWEEEETAVEEPKSKTRKGSEASVAKEHSQPPEASAVLPPGLVLATQEAKQEAKQEPEPKVVLRATSFEDLARQLGGGSVAPKVVPKVTPAGGAVVPALSRDAEEDPWGDADEFGSQPVLGED